MRLLLTLLVVLGIAPSSTFAQTAPDPWVKISPDAVVLTGNAHRTMEPLQYSAFTLDYDAITTFLTQAPREFTAAARQNSFIVTLPMANGKKEEFSVVKTRIMDPALEAQHPEIGTYAGQALHFPEVQVRITVTPGWGLRAMITRQDKGIEYIEPLAEGQNQYYMAYDRVDLPRNEQAAKLMTRVETPPSSDELLEQTSPRFALNDPGPDGGAKLLGSPVELKVYRFACAATGEFSQDNGGTKDLVFQKITQMVNQLNAIYERDINVRLTLIPESYDIIFLDPDTDPYTGTEVGGWMSQNPAIMAQYLGSANKYDIGHVFARYIDGAAIGVAGGLTCTQFKGRGCSAWTGPPYGDEFFAIVGQEIGHQWASGHTFNQCFAGAQFDYDSACEPGSGSTIMSYNGSCGDNNISGGNTALFYHACSIAEIRYFNYFQEGATCGSILPTTNTAPMVTTPYPPVTFIPIRTPFELTGSAVDAESTNLTYSWDEIDRGPTSPLGSPSGNAPAFRWFEPTSSPTRTFPRIQTVISNVNSITEVLPTYNRDITFVLTVRDNQLDGGGVSWDTVDLRATTLAGPFLVKYPTELNTIWKVGEYRTITWDVANTDAAPVNCKFVNIKLSSNGGTTFPVTLAEHVPNTGAYCIQVPNNVSLLSRIRIEAADNVFFDISNVNFKIEQPAPGFSICAGIAKDYACLPGNYTSTISTVGLSDFTDNITLSATGLPSGAVATFSPNPVAPGATSVMSVTFPGNSPENTFDMTVVGTSGANTVNSIVTLTVVNNDFSSFGPTSPANGASGVNKQPALKWSLAPDADKYDVELATNPSFAAATIVASKQNVTVDSMQAPNPLQEGHVYYWHVRPKNSCGNANWSEVQAFVVAIQNCATHEATDVPKNITANGTPTIESKITINAGGALSDVNVKKIQGNHQFFKDLEVHLISPAGTDVLLWKDKCSGFNGNFSLGMDDGAPGTFNCPPPNTGAAYKPTGTLSSFNGQSAAGDWILRVKDNVISSGGTLVAFELELCSSVALNPPLVVANSPLVLPSGQNALIGETLLRAEDANNTPAQLVFTIMSLPQHGQLLVNGVIAEVGAQLTQADIANSGLRYYDYGWNNGADSFNFSVTDGEGGLATGTYHITATVGTHSPETALSFEIAPNPASSVAVLSLTQPLDKDARVALYNASGQLVQTWQLEAGAYALRLDISQLPKGVYAVSLTNDAVKSVKKLVVH